MSEIKDIIGAISESKAEIVKEVYSDVAKPLVQPTGEIAGLIPRAVKAALAPLEKWIMQKEYNIAETKKLLEEKLKDVKPENIESPEAHVAVPALQYLSYCMDNEDLRDMYANLLANSMNSIIKKGVHPGFVEIIKQLSPDEAKVMKYFAANQKAPTITLRYELKDGGGIDVVRNFSNIGELVGCEQPLDINMYFDNLIRLGLIQASPSLASLTDKELYKPLKEHPVIEELMNPNKIVKTEYEKASIVEGFMSRTDFGEAFCNICLTIQNPDNT